MERIAATLPLPGEGESVEIWDGLYGDLASLFRFDHAALRGRRLLLTDDGRLGRCNGGPPPARAAPAARPSSRPRRAPTAGSRCPTRCADGSSTCTRAWPASRNAANAP
ncbi:hypothetical protein KCH_10820 [Kitasatospora cheerisanensis KCTC 2395]|uniref:Uncharacterized protein n=1 Tax=Kitasatospora cheerisanensis KCTC 2395 TaxID=1348663 RepID=A0A066Z0G0_9ACTN|nr:hypothetical protein KCH_10820 [Kitasatospora cheerisanensis KCTC 2395]